MATFVQSVSRALAILNVLAAHPAGLSVKEISQRAGLNVSTTHHLVNTLVADNYIHRTANGTCFLGLAVATLYGTLCQSMQPDARMQQALDSLARETRETTYINTWQNGEIVVQAIHESPQALRIGGLYIGFRGAAHARAGGKALLAYLSEPELQAYFAAHELHPVTANTIYQPEQVRQHLQQVAAQGYATDHEEFAEGACCVSAPVFTMDGKAVAALSVSVPAKRFADNEAQLIQAVVRAAREVSITTQPAREPQPALPAAAA